MPIEDFNVIILDYVFFVDWHSYELLQNSLTQVSSSSYSMINEPNSIHK
jgi:hypothetical protein